LGLAFLCRIGSGVLPNAGKKLYNRPSILH
jgi:hypothetical protein